MENKKSLLNLSSIDILPNLSIRIPTVREILENEQHYYSIVSYLTMTPFQYMVQLDDMGIDYTKITDYDLFKMLFCMCAKFDLSILLGNLNVSDFTIHIENHEETIYSPSNNIKINELVYNNLVDAIRKINFLEKEKYKPGNESAKEYLLKQERKRQKLNAKKPYKPQLERLVITLVNTSDFPYDYDSCMDLSIYRFNQSLKQILHKVAFTNTMFGIYSGNIDVSKMNNKDILSLVSK